MCVEMTVTAIQCDKISPDGQTELFACILYLTLSFFLQNPDVWKCCSLITIVITVIMFSQFMHPTIRGKMSSFDIVSFVIGAVCQQGTHLVVTTLSGRFIVITTFLATLAIFTSYSASIVGKFFEGINRFADLKFRNFSLQYYSLIFLSITPKPKSFDNNH